MAARLVARGISYNLDKPKTPLLKDISLDTGGFGRVAIVGPSGIGKTTLFEILAALKAPAQGEVTVDGRPHDQAEIGFCYQDRRLAPWLTLRDNIAYFLPTGRDKSVIDEMISRLGLEASANTLASLASGGEQARCAIGRALVSEPELLLLDEPLNGLDKQVRDRVAADLRALQEERGFLLLLISHDIDDVEAICEQVHVLQGRPAEIVSTVRLNASLLPEERAHAIQTILAAMAG